MTTGKDPHPDLPLIQKGSSITADGAAIVTHDTNELPSYSRQIYCGGAGDIKLITVGGTTLTFKAVPVGTLLPVRAKLVFATGTTATNLVAIW